MKEENKIGKAIRHYRNVSRMTQKELAAKVFLDENTIGHYETGKRTPPIENLLIIAKELQTSISSLIEPKNFITLPNEDELIHEHFSFLERHPKFIRKRDNMSGRGIVYDFSFTEKENYEGEIHIAIDKKLLSISYYNFLRVKYKVPVMDHIFETPLWFKELFCLSFETLFQLQKEKEIPTTFDSIATYSVVKRNFLTSNQSYNHLEFIKKEYNENKRIFSNDETVTQTIFECIQNTNLPCNMVKRTYYEIQ